MPWPAPEVHLRGDANELAVAERAAVHVPSLTASLGGDHTISVSAASSSPEIVVEERRTKIVLPPGELPDPAALALLVASRAAAVREEGSALSFHASAVVREGRGVLIVGPTLAGKTSIGLDLASRDWALSASNVSLVASSGLLLAGSRAVTVREAAGGGGGGRNDPFALRLDRYLEGHPPARLVAILLIASAPGSALFAPLDDAALELLNAAAELPRRCVALGSSLVDVGIDTVSRAAARLTLCRRLADRVPVWRVSGEPVAVADWIDARWR